MPSPSPIPEKVEPHVCNRTNAPTHDGGLRRLIPAGLDPGDLLLLCIILLLMIESDEDDALSLLITAVAFLLF